MRKSTKGWIALAVLVGVLSAGGWALSGLLSSGMKANMNATQAQARATALLNDTVAALQPPVTWQDGPTGLDRHMSAFGGDYDGTASVVVTRWVTVKVSAAKLDRFEQAVESRWRQHGYHVTTTRTYGGTPQASAQTSDGGGISMNADGKGGVSFAVTVGPFATSTNKSLPLDPVSDLPTDAKGYPTPVTLTKDPYWSN